MDTTYAFLVIAFFSTSNNATIPEGSTIINLKAILSNHLCQQPLQHGNCSQKILRFYYNNRDHKCRKFTYSGCNGNDNRFFTRQQCQAKCGRRRKFHAKQFFSTICNQRFDLRYRTLCHQNKSTWQIRYFYDIEKNLCQLFWYSGCKELERNRNIFTNERTCKSLCVRKTYRKLEDKPKDSILKKRIKTDFFVNAYIKTINATKSKMLNVNQNHTSVYVNSTSANDPSQIRALHSDIDEASMDDNVNNNFGFIILSAELHRFLQKISRRAAKEDDNVTTYHFDQSTSTLSKCDEFDSKLPAICNITEWTPRYYYDMKNNKCRIFWISGCILDSRDNFENTTGCQKQCIIRWPNSRTNMERCKPFVYCGCDGNLNHFLMLRQCQEMCHQFRDLSPMKMNCPLPLDGGVRFEKSDSAEKAGTCYYYNQKYGECFESLDRGHWCESMSYRYYYNSDTNTCKGFHYTGCGQSRNIFVTQEECEEKYNITGKKTRLTSYLCSVKSDGICSKQVFMYSGKILLTTNGDEKCHVVQPSLKSIHLYSWFFTVDRRSSTNR